MAKLSAVRLAKRFKSCEAVRDISLEVSSGQVVGLLGPNGAGKTTCFYMMLGLLPCDAGEIFLDDFSLTGLSTDQRARLGLGYLPQESSIFRKLSVQDNIMAVLELRSGLSHSDRNRLMESLLNEFHITHIRQSIGMSLSGGERRRVEIARALASNPKILLLDEPFAGVDPVSVLDIKRIIHHLKSSNIGILITDHNVRETLDVCETAYIVNEGVVIAEGASDVIINNEQVRKVYLGEQFKL